MEETMRFQGKIAAWFWGILIEVNSFLIYGLIFSREEWMSLLIGFGIVNLVFLPMILRNYVLVDDTTLKVCFGFISDQIRLDEIQAVRESHTLLAASAASLDRIVIKGARKELICAVYEKQLFYRELEKRNQKLICPKN